MNVAKLTEIVNATNVFVSDLASKPELRFKALDNVGTRGNSGIYHFEGDDIAADAVARLVD